MGTYTLSPGKTPDNRMAILTGIADEAKERVLHCDVFRQRNMNYALVVFAGFIALGAQSEGATAHLMVSVTLTVLMLIFALWDRRWHRNKHGWQKTRDAIRKKIVELSNDPSQEVQYETYYGEGEKTAELFSFQPLVFYLLVAVSAISYFLFGFVVHAS